MFLKETSPIFLFLILLSHFIFSHNKQSTITNNKSDVKTVSGDHIVLYAKDIKEMHVQTMPELLNRLPGISAGETSVKIQGATNVRVLLDGRPVNDPSSAHSGVNWNTVSVNDIQKLEILIGGGAAIVGDGTSGGAIILTSKKNEMVHGHIDASAGNFATEDITFRFGQKLSKINMGASGGYYSTDGDRINNDKTKKRASACVGIGDNNKNGDISIDYTSDERGNPGKPQWPTIHARSKNESVNSSLNCIVNQWKFNTYYSNTLKKSSNSDKPVETEFDGWNTGIKATKSFKLGSFSPLNVGVEGNYENAEGFSKSVMDTSNYNDHEWYAGIWTSKDFKIRTNISSLNLSTGLRFNIYSAFNPNINPELRLRCNFWKLNVNVGTAMMHNAPTLSKRYYESSSTYRNPDLIPEKGINSSFGIGFNQNGSDSPRKIIFGCNMQCFYNFINDRITYITSSNSSMGIYQNVGRVVRRGADFSLSIKFDSIINTFDINFDASIGILDARDLDSDLFLTSSPKEIGKMTIGLKAFKLLSFQLTGEYTGKQYTASDNKSTSQPYYLLNAVFDLRINKINLYIKSDNIQNTKYTYGDGYPGAPREYVAGIRCEF